MPGDDLDVAGNGSELRLGTQSEFQFEEMSVCFVVRIRQVPVVRKYTDPTRGNYLQFGIREHLNYVCKVKYTDGLSVERIHNGLRGKIVFRESQVRRLDRSF